MKKELTKGEIKMFEKLKKIKENKVLKFIGNVLYTIMFILVVLMLLVVVMQRVTNNNIAIGGIRMFSVATGSMIPVYEVGDILISKEIEPEKIEVGDDLIYLGKEGSFKNKIVTHRVNSIEKQEDGNYKIITQGVANNAEDPEINQTQVLGKVMFKMHLLSYLGKLVRNVYMFYFVIFIPVGILVYRNIKNLMNAAREEDDDEEEDKEKNCEK